MLIKLFELLLHLWNESNQFVNFAFFFLGNTAKQLNLLLLLSNICLVVRLLLLENQVLGLDFLIQLSVLSKLGLHPFVFVHYFLNQALVGFYFLFEEFNVLLEFVLLFTILINLRI